MSEVEGRIESGKWIQTHLSRVLLQLERGKRTGALHLTATEVTQLVIVEGHIVFAEAPEDTALLFERLVNEGSLEPISARRIERRVAEATSWSGIVRAAELVIQDARVAPNMLRVQQASLATRSCWKQRWWKRSVKARLRHAFERSFAAMGVAFRVLKKRAVWARPNTCSPLAATACCALSMAREPSMKFSSRARWEQTKARA